MRSSEIRVRLLAAALLALVLAPAPAHADVQAQGFGLERLTPSPAGAGWFSVDSLDMHGGLGGAAAVTASFAHDPLVVTASDGSRLAVVANSAFVDYGFAATWDRFRFSLDFSQPLWTKGDSGSVGGYAYSAPALDLGSNPDTLGDARLGVDARLFGEADGPLRLGLGAQLYAPNNSRDAYVTDGTFRAMFRLLGAGDLGRFTYAGSVGVHVRPLDDAPVWGSPRGSELLFAIGGGYRVPLGDARAGDVTIGPELFGASALKSLFGATTTALEGLLTARWQQGGEGAHLGVRIGAGGGLHPEFGAPEWRTVLSVELVQPGR